MYIKVDSELLAKNLKNTAYIVAKFKQESDLASVKLKTADNSVVITLSNDSDKAIITLPCSVIEQGECCVTAHKFIGTVQSFIGEIELVQVDNIFVIKQDKIKINLPIVKNDLFSNSFQNLTYTGSLIISGMALNNMISVVTPFVDTTAGNVISGINIQAQESWIKARACHNAAMAISTHKCKVSEDCRINITLQTETLQAISKLFIEEDVEIKVTDFSACFIGKSCTIYTRAINGTYPSIDTIVENEELCSISINRQLLDKCLHRILIIKTLCKKLNLTAKNQMITIGYEQSLTESFNIQQNGSDVQLAVNYEYLLAVLRVFSGAMLNIKITPTYKLKFVDENNIITVCPLC